MDVKTARAAIGGILAAIPDDELPEFDRVEVRTDGKVCVWWGSTGHILGSAKTQGERDPIAYRHDASCEAIQHEMTYRADRRLFENGDDPTGVRLARKVA